MIKFKEVTEHDLELIRKWRTSYEVTKYMYTEPKITQRDQITWFHTIQNEDTSKYRLIEFGGVNVGLVYITDIDYNSRHCVWGIYIGESKYKIFGVGALSTYKIINYVFDELNMNKLTSMVLSYNEEAIKLNESFGFTRYGHYREHCYKHGKYFDMYGYSLLRKDWTELKPYFEKRLERGK
jgi:UDP-4-amino-4,6-dideoxy-N-acetyl-beta-L-altrosamine N-acetyltransferase